MRTQQHQSGTTTPHGRATALLVALCGLALVHCGFFTDLVTPQDLSRATVAIVVLDSTSTTPHGIAQALVTVDGDEGLTDSAGHIQLRDAYTGEASVLVAHPHYHPDTHDLDVDLEGICDTFYLSTRSFAPVVGSFLASPDPTLAIDDTVVFTIAVHDSVWPIRGINVWFGDGTMHSALFPGAVPEELSIKHVYDSSETFDPLLVVFNTNGDTTIDSSLQVDVDANRRPGIAVSLPISGFFSGIAARVTFTAYDPEGALRYIDVDWGDGGPHDAETNSDTVSLLHTYAIRDSLAAIDSFTITVLAADEEGAVATLTQRVDVRRAKPVLVSPLQFSPKGGQLDRGIDDSITISMTVEQANYHITSILWQVNPTALNFEHRAYAQGTYDNLTGSIPSQGGRSFSHTFPVALLPDTNVVEVRVRDALLLDKTQFGTFYVR